MSNEIAVIGAGIAGLAAAQCLRQAGFAITVFEKSRGLGGRMASRRAGEFRFDHGAQYFTAKGGPFRSAVRRWQAAGLVDEWFDGAFVGKPKMTAPAGDMAAGQLIVGETEIVSLSRDDGAWSVYAKDGLVATPANGRFLAVVLAIPAPQAATLTASVGTEFPELESVRFLPCWALMLGFSQPTGISSDRMSRQDDMVAWIARDSSKPGRTVSGDTFVVHASPEWSRQNLQMAAEAVSAQLLAGFRRLTGVLVEPVFSRAHRWRYARVEQAAVSPFQWDAEIGLGACGDWCIGPRVEAAFESGLSLAQAIQRTRGLGHG